MPRGGSEEDQSRKLFIGGLSFDTTDDNLHDHFAFYGTIEDSIVIKDSNTKQSKGFGFVTYTTEEQADKCMAARPHTLQNREVDVKRAVSREESNKPGAHVQVKKIFVGGLREGHNLDEHTLREHFKHYGEVESCELPVNKDSQKQRAFVFVTFRDFDTVDKLVAKRKIEINGIQCDIKKALSRTEMDKAKQRAEERQSRGGRNYEGGRDRNFDRGDNYGGGNYGGRGRYDNYNDGRGYRGGGNDDGYYGNQYNGGGGYGDYNGDGYGNGYGDNYGDGYGDNYGDGYGDGYGGYSSNYGPMKGGQHYGQRQGGPYGGGYGSGGGGSGYGGYGRY